MNLQQYEKSTFNGKIEKVVRLAEQIRADKENPQEVSLEEICKVHLEAESLEAVFADLGIDPTVDTINMMYNLPDDDIRWLIPEIIREAIRLGLRDAPIWSAITAVEMATSQLKVKMPYINMSDAAPRRVGEAETIPTGTISYGDKDVSVYKIGRGIKISYEVKNFVSIDVVSIFMQDFGIKLGMALDTLAIDTLINGDQGDGSESAPVIGVGTVNAKEYKDYLRLWVRGSRMGRNFSTILGGETTAIDTLDLPEFKDRKQGTVDFTINMKTPVPSSADYFVHGNIAAKQELMVDTRFSLVKFNVIPLAIESEKIVSNQTEAFYATLTTGFGKLFRDASIIMDSGIAFATNGFPDYMDVDAFQNVTIE